jgi:Ca-activated chloride channel homolog
LIRLSKKYGIVTPYTSFLADERPVAYSHKEIRERAIPLLSQSLESISGPQAQVDASTRAEALDVSQLTKLQSPSGHAVRMGRVNQSEYESGRTAEINSVRVIGNTTLYKRGDAWLTSDVMDLDLTRDRSSFRVIQRYSDEYFALIAENNPEENQVLAAQQSNEKLALKLRGIAYIIE